MARVNRYTQIKPADYNPMSLQELMLAPSYKRQEHDKLLEAAGTIDTAIAQVDPLAVHNEAALKEQERLRENINKQVDLLNTEGFNPSSKSAFINLNKDYQQSISPTGLLGRINQAKKTLNANRDEYIKTGVEMGYSPENLLQNWQKFEDEYINQFATTGEVSDIGKMYAPKYYDYINEAKSIFKDAGITASDITTGGGRIVQDSKGNYVVNSQIQDAKSSNKKQLQAAVDFLNNTINNPNSDAYKSIQHQNKSREQVISELTDLAGVYEKEQTGSKKIYSINSFKAAEATDQLSSNGLTATTNRFDSSDMPNTYSGVIEAVADLEEKETLTQDEQYRLNKYKEIQDQYKQELAKKPEAKEILNYIEEVKTRTSYTDQEKAMLESGFKPTDIQFNRIQNINRAQKELDNMMEDISKDVKLMTQSYTFTPTNTKQESYKKVMGNTFNSLVRESPQALEQNTNILRVESSDGEGVDDLTENDKTEISKMFYNANPGDIEVMSFTPKTLNGLPGYRLRLKTKDSYNLDGLSKGKIGGEDDFISVDVTFDSNNNGIIKNINGYAQQYLANSGADGRMLAEQMTSNMKRHSYRGMTWEQVNNNGSFNADPSIKQEFLKEIKKELPSDKTEITKEEYKNAVNRVLNKTVY